MAANEESKGRSAQRVFKAAPYLAGGCILPACDALPFEKRSSTCTKRGKELPQPWPQSTCCSVGDEPLAAQ
eukprot:1157981-Pelagomonas_calceolata.AAC.5